MNFVKQYPLSTLADLLQARLVGDPACIISGLATLQDAFAGKSGLRKISFDDSR